QRLPGASQRKLRVGRNELIRLPVERMTRDPRVVGESVGPALNGAPCPFGTGVREEFVSAALQALTNVACLTLGSVGHHPGACRSTRKQTFETLHPSVPSGLPDGCVGPNMAEVLNTLLHPQTPASRKASSL